MMKKNPTIILKSTLALLLIISISFAAKSQPIVNPEKVEPYSYSRDDEFFSFDMTKLVNLDEATSAGLHITGKKGVPAELNIVLTGRGSDSPVSRLSDLIANSSNLRKGAATVTIILSNGESLVTHSAWLQDIDKETLRKDKSDSGIQISTDFISLRSNTSGSDNQVSNNNNDIFLLSNYDILSIALQNNIIAFSQFRTAATFSAMFNSLRERVKDPYMYGGTKNIISKSTAFSFEGTVNFVYPPTSSHMKFLKENIKEKGACRTGSITATGPGVSIFGSNGYAYTSTTPDDLKNLIISLHDRQSKIIDVNITEAGGYVVIYDDYGFSLRGNCPQSFTDKLHYYNNMKEPIMSACFNDKGNWVIVTKGKFAYSDNYIRDFLLKAESMYGELLSVFISNNGIVACCTYGVLYQNVPSNLVDKLHTINFIPRVIKFTDNGLMLLTDGSSEYDYFM
jgi:hypothetical protein